MKMNLKTLIIPLVMAGSVFSGCGNKVEKTPVKQNKKTVGDVTYTIIDVNMVGTEQDHNRSAAFLHEGDADESRGGARRSVYFLKEGAVVTEFHTEYKGGTGGKTGVNPRPIRQMLDFEYAEYQIAKAFYDSCMGIKTPVIEAQSDKSVTDTVKKNSLKVGPQ